MKRVLVTGYKGFIGSRFLELYNDKYEIVVGEMDSIDFMEETFKQCKFDCVFHIGAITDTTSVNGQEMFKYNAWASDVIIKAALSRDTPVIFSSSASLYGKGDSIPLNLYAWSKWATENKWAGYKNFTALRYFNVYGIGEHNKNPKMTSVLYQHLKKDTFFLFGGEPKPKRDFVYVDDVLSANIHAFENKLWGVYDVGTAVARPFEDFASILDRGVSYIKNPIQSQYQNYTCADEKKFLTNWKPKYTLETAIEEIVKYYNV